jgi:hypothetical protein
MTTQRPAKLRALTSNRPWSLPGVLETSAQHRRFRDLCEAYAAEFGAATELTEAQRVLIRNAAMSAMAAEGAQARLLLGEPIDPDTIVRLAGASARAIEAVRAHQPPKPREPTFDERLAQRRASQAVTA